VNLVLGVPGDPHPQKLKVIVTAVQSHIHSTGRSCLHYIDTYNKVIFMAFGRSQSEGLRI